MDKGNHPNQYLDRVFSYKKSGDRITAHFFLQTENPFEMKLDKDILSGFTVNFLGQQNNFYREIYNVYWMNVKTGYLVHSYVYYLNPEDNEKNFNPVDFPYAPPRTTEHFQFLTKKLPENYVKIGWHGPSWQCRSVSYVLYLMYSVEEFLMQVLGV